MLACSLVRLSTRCSEGVGDGTSQHAQKPPPAPEISAQAAAVGGEVAARGVGPVL